MRTANGAAALAVLLSPRRCPASVHPHVFAEARLDVVVNPDQTVKSLRHLWRFDDLFSSTVLVEFDTNSDLKLDDAELQEVSQDGLQPRSPSTIISSSSRPTARTSR